MLARLDWRVDGADWPNREASRFVEAAGLRWHVQTMGHGPVLLLVHGMGASTHSWRDLAPLLATRYRVVAFDLPGHAFTDTADRSGMSLDGMSRLIEALLGVLQVRPRVAVGHSAGAAILASMALARRFTPEMLVAFNGAFVPFDGILRIFSPVAKFLASTSLVAEFAAARGRDPAAVARLLRGTGSTLDARGVELYGRLVHSPAHVAGALAMMAGWDLRGLLRELPRLSVPTRLIVGGNDETVPPAQSDRIAALVPGCRVERLAQLGHLAHEERPDLAAEAVFRFAGELSGGD
jgi:magnesium chelatase accessory protein